MYNCPACGNPTFSFWQKQFLGPLRKIECQSCGVAVSVPWARNVLFSFLVGLLPPLVGVGAVALVGEFASLWSMVGVFALGTLIASAPFLWLYHRYVPLVVKKARSTNAA